MEKSKRRCAPGHPPGWREIRVSAPSDGVPAGNADLQVGAARRRRANELLLHARMAQRHPAASSGRG